MIGRLKKRFATHGFPDTFHSDNGPPFSSNEFSAFAIRVRTCYQFAGVSAEQWQSGKCSQNSKKSDEEIF